jgi:hypothetical protein
MMMYVIKDDEEWKTGMYGQQNWQRSQADKAAAH